jgi:hypothetical protein
LRKLLGEVYALNADRVRVVHGLWFPFEEGGIVSHVPRSSLKTTRFANQAEALERRANEANALRAWLEDEFTALREGSSR